jgi:hypothetical protein
MLWKVAQVEEIMCRELMYVHSPMQSGCVNKLGQYRMIYSHRATKHAPPYSYLAGHQLSAYDAEFLTTDLKEIFWRVTLSFDLTSASHFRHGGSYE